jgi:WD40-like Beta Propeller Repeat
MPLPPPPQGGRGIGRGGVLAIVLAFAVLWGSAGVGVYKLLGSRRGAIAQRAARPGEAGAGVNPALAHLPGTVYLVQDGALYRLQQGRFTPVLGAGGWSQPSTLPDGSVVLVKRDPSGYSDLYRIDTAGRLQQLTHDNGKGAVQGIDPGGQLVTQYWAMFPRTSPDGKQLYFATDRYKHVRCCPFDVTLRLAQMPITGGTPKFWTIDAVTQTDTHTEDGDYAGGDSHPIPLASGGLLFERYAYAGNNLTSQLMLTRQARAAATPLTAGMDRCDEPSLSPDGTRVAMVCSYGRQSTTVEVAAFDGTSLGPRQVLVAGVQAAQPVWSPDGKQLLYVAPVGISGHFQLWSVATPAVLPTPIPTAKPAGRSRLAAPAPSAPPPAAVPPTVAVGPRPVQLTQNLDFDATSPIAWAA